MFPPELAAMLDGYASSTPDSGKSGAKVYRFSRASRPALYLKTGAKRIADAILDEAVRLRWLSAHLPCPRIRYFVHDGTNAWMLTTGLPGRSAYDYLMTGTPSARAGAVRAIGEFLKRLHSLPLASCPFDSDHRVRMAQARRNLDAGLVDETDFDTVRQGWTAEQVWDEVRKSAPRGMDRVVTHGDFSLDNIFIHRGKVTGVIDVGRLGVADPYQDLAILWNNLPEFGVAMQKAMFEAYGIRRPDKRKLHFHLCLDELF